MNTRQKTVQELIAAGAKWVMEQGRLLKTPEGNYWVPANERVSVPENGTMMVQTN